MLGYTIERAYQLNSSSLAPYPVPFSREAFLRALSHPHIPGSIGDVAKEINRSFRYVKESFVALDPKSRHTYSLM